MKLNFIDTLKNELYIFMGMPTIEERINDDACEDFHQDNLKAESCGFQDGCFDAAQKPYDGVGTRFEMGSLFWEQYGADRSYFYGYVSGLLRSNGKVEIL